MNGRHAGKFFEKPAEILAVEPYGCGNLRKRNRFGKMGFNVGYDLFVTADLLTFDGGKLDIYRDESRLFMQQCQ